MIPRTVQMAKEVAAQFSAAQLDSYGNIILNGYLEVVPNTTNRKAWQYKETTTAPVNLPNLTEVRPALKGWTTNYYEYYTQLPPNAYNQEPGNPTMFEYDVHSWTLFEGPILEIAGFLNNGSGYTPGTYTAVATTTSGSGTGATVDVVVTAAPGAVSSVSVLTPGSGYTPSSSLTNVTTETTYGTGYGLELDITTTAGGAVSSVSVSAGYAGRDYTVGSIVSVGTGTAEIQVTGVNSTGIVTSITLASAGTGYAVGDTLVPTLSPGTGASIQITAIDLESISGGGNPQWSQPPHRYNQQQVATITPPQYVNNPAVIQYSFMYPVADNPVPPPIDIL